jgi:predicted DNA-binding transcriptional regulator AlpA
MLSQGVFAMSKERLWKMIKVCNVVGASRATIDRWRDEGLFPEPVILKRRKNGRPTSIRWKPEDVEAWLSTR